MLRKGLLFCMIFGASRRSTGRCVCGSPRPGRSRSGGFRLPDATRLDSRLPSVGWPGLCLGSGRVGNASAASRKVGTPALDRRGHEWVFVEGRWR